MWREDLTRHISAVKAVSPKPYFSRNFCCALPGASSSGAPAVGGPGRSFDPYFLRRCGARLSSTFLRCSRR